jgi:hypothetical protein
MANPSYQLVIKIHGNTIELISEFFLRDWLTFSVLHGWYPHLFRVHAGQNAWLAKGGLSLAAAYLSRVSAARTSVNAN